VKYQPDLIQPGTVVATVDAQPSFFQMNGQMRFDVIIDHHPLATSAAPLRRRPADLRLHVDDPDRVFPLLGPAPQPRAATALYYGLKTDTGNLTRNVSDAT